jgi:L-alanine-DL-glutamate epimerase-like enolase superfamily enzyme
MYLLNKFKDYLVSGAASVVQVDVARIGGITAWIKVAHMAEAHSISVCPHFLMELHVSLVCAVPNTPWLEYVPQLDSVTYTGKKWSAGGLFPARNRGWGLTGIWMRLNFHAYKIQAYGCPKAA